MADKIRSAQKSYNLCLGHSDSDLVEPFSRKRVGAKRHKREQPSSNKEEGEANDAEFS